MHIITRKALKDFWEKHPQAETPLREWFRVVRQSEWKGFAELRQTYPSADQVGRCTVFNIGGNKYRLVVRIQFKYSKVYIRRVLTHDQYDRDDWKGDC
ncbi:MAG: type II toxin-antitoxin system HigB family toxin [Planctomycetota bacterium]